MTYRLGRFFNAAVKRAKHETTQMAKTQTSTRWIITVGMFGDTTASDETAKSQQFSAEEQERIKAHIRARGMSFLVFLPEAIANWLREKVAAGVFKDPAEAAFVAFQDMRELDLYPAIRRELLKATVNGGATDQSK